MKIDQALGSLRLDPASLSIDRAPLHTAGRVWLHRLAFWGPITVSTAAAAVLAGFATTGTAGWLRWPVVGLMAANVLYMALTGMPSLIGFVLHLCGRRLVTAAQPSGVSRTALLMPVHCEDPQTVFAAIEVMARSIAESGLDRVDIFVLSDTQDPAMAVAEQAAYDALVARAPAGPALHYRRRKANAGRKSGNLADFCARWGQAYDYMLVLDADSLMGTSAIARLIGLMDAHPRAGIIQTVPHPVGRDTLFARMQQFSARLYGPLLVEGLTFWQQGDGNYWGHNAIVRIAPFVAHCELPVLPGREPWGGEILCHDVVEAGLMRGAGWDVWVLPEVLESYEAVPANMVDFSVRERRWCQGNLQHSRLLALPGFQPVGRFHLGYGVFHYLAAPVLVLSVMLLVADALCGGGLAAALLHGRAAGWLIGLGAALLYAGKGLSLLAALSDRPEARRFGGRRALLASAALEQLVCFVSSPMFILAYTRYVVDLVLGRTVGWDTQARDDRGVSWSEGWVRTRLLTGLGVGWLLLLPFMGTAVAVCTAPVFAGLSLAWPLTVLSSRVGLGRLARRFGLLLTPEELSPPPVVRAFQRAALSQPVAERAAPTINVLQLVPSGGE